MSLIIRVNTKSKGITTEQLKSDCKYFGNRGLITKIMNHEVNPKCDPLGSENKLILCTGIFAGTVAAAAHRLSVGGKSPLTGTIKEANAGGNAGYLLAGHDIKMIIFEETPSNEGWFLLHIDKKGMPKLVEANGYTGLNNYALVENLKKTYGDEIGAISIGVAGERKYNNACLMVTDGHTGHPSRAAGRGGLGAVLGSKKIKAVIIEKPEVRHKVQYADRERFINANKKLIDMLSGVNMPIAGTMTVVDIFSPLGIMPVKNFRGGNFNKLDQISTQTYLNKVHANGGKTKIACQPGCPVKCSNIIKNSKGEYVTSGFEYETAVFFGPNCEIGNLDFMFEMDRVCDDFGVDTIEAGNAVTMCMEAGKIPWGDEEAVRNLMKEMVDGTEFGILLGKGTETVGKALGVKRIPVVKGQSMPGYDPRHLKGTGVTFATTAMGADHTCGTTLAPNMDHKKRDGQVELSIKMQKVYATADNCSCIFNFTRAADKSDIWPEMFAGLFGGQWDVSKVLDIGAQTIKLERAFNKAAGFTEEDDRLPEFFYQEQAEATGEVYDITPEELAKAYSK